MGVSSPEEVSQIFDGISYGKGAVFLRMLRLIVGDAKFQQILRTYIAKK
jgi:aminopeptidase N